MIESLKIKRITATILLGFIAWFIGLFSALSFNLLSEFTIFGKNFFDATDFLTNQIMLPLGGIFIAIFVGCVMKKENVLEELDIEENFDLDLIAELKKKGHKINYPVLPIGGGQIIINDVDKGISLGASDWRKDGIASGI